MDPKALIKAQSRLRIAQKTLTEIADSQSYEEFTDLWYTFLVAAKNVYTTLEQGAKVSAQSRQWFGAKKNERRQDPLLQYMFQARDDAEHGIEAVTELVEGNLFIGITSDGPTNGPVIRTMEMREDGTVFIDGVQRDPSAAIRETPSTAKLVPVVGRGHIVYPPPSHHLGKQLEDQGPFHVAKLTLDYLQTLVAEAESRAA